MYYMSINQLYNDDPLTTARTAELLGVPAYTVHRMAKAGVLPVAFRAPGIRGALFFERTDVESLRDRRTGGDL